MTCSAKRAYIDRPLTVRCGQCIGCRLERARVWAVRCTHEASLYENNIFATITYSDDNIPFGNSLDREDLTKFFKRMRKRTKIRLFYCGEYGDETIRPHYHALIFNCAPPDPELMAVREGKKVFRSDTLDKLWGLGHINYYDTIEFASAAYVAGYVTKKITGPDAERHYTWTDPETGEIYERQPEFSGQSLKPGIGERWIKKYLRDVYAKDEIIVNGQPTRPPRYYDQILEREDPKLFDQVMRKRREQHPKYTIQETTIHRGGYSTVHYRAPKLDVDPDQYRGSERQKLAKKKILQSRQKKRKEQ